MKDYLGVHKWWNRPLTNPTQTRYARFVQGPHHIQETALSRIGREFESRLKDATTTRYSDLLD